MKLSEAEAMRPSWADPREPRFADLRDRDLSPDQARAEAMRRRASMDDYPASIPYARRLDDLIARGIVDDLNVAVVLADTYGVELTRQQLAVARVELRHGAMRSQGGAI